MVSIWLDPSFSSSTWCTHLVNGLYRALRQKRIPYRMISLPKLHDSKKEQFVFVIGSDLEWISHALLVCNQKNCYPILLSNHFPRSFNAKYSAVFCEPDNPIHLLLDTLYSKNCEKIALYGINMKSASDRGFLSTFALVQGNKVTDSIFVNNGSLDNCYQSFISKVESFDAVICPNDLIAVSLVRRLYNNAPEFAKRLVICSCCESIISEYYTQHLHTIHINYGNYGNAGVSIFEILQKNPYLASIHMSVKIEGPTLKHNLDAQSAPLFTGEEILVDNRDIFYDDPELNDIMCIEKLLDKGDETDRVIIEMLINDNSYSEIAEKCFLTESSIKYHIKNMMRVCGVRGKSQLVLLLKRYLGKI